jgi:5-methylcytosine-specific restriction endonuclease McrA
LRTDPGYLREKVFERDKGVCAHCGIDTVKLRRDMRKLDYAARREFLKKWKLREGSRKSLWDADHVIPVAEGGGQCDLSNMRTLCLMCHLTVTSALRERLSETRAKPIS